MSTSEYSYATDMALYKEQSLNYSHKLLHLHESLTNVLSRFAAL